MVIERVQHMSHLAQIQAAGALPAPSGPSDGVSTATWSNGAGSHSRCLVRLDGSAPATVSSALLWGYDGSRWDVLGQLNSGQPMTITDDSRGWALLADYVGGFARLAVSGTVSAGTVAVTFTPLQVS